MEDNELEEFRDSIVTEYKGGGYPPLPPLDRRGSTAVKIAAGPGGEGGDVEAFQKYSWSAIVARLAKAAGTLVGSLRDGSVTDPLLRRAITDAHILGFIIMSMPCVNRDGRETEALRRVHDAQDAIAVYPGRRRAAPPRRRCPAGGQAGARRQPHPAARTLARKDSLLHEHPLRRCCNGHPGSR